MTREELLIKIKELQEYLVLLKLKYIQNAIVDKTLNDKEYIKVVNKLL